MKKSAKLDPLAERPDVDFSKGIRGKYTNLLAKGTNLVVLDPDLLESFPDSPSVNRALRAFLAINQQVQSASPRIRSRRPPSSASNGLDTRGGVRYKAAGR